MAPPLDEKVLDLLKNPYVVCERGSERLELLGLMLDECLALPTHWEIARVLPFFVGEDREVGAYARRMVEDHGSSDPEQVVKIFRQLLSRDRSNRPIIHVPIIEAASCLPCRTVAVGWALELLGRLDRAMGDRAVDRDHPYCDDLDLDSLKPCKEDYRFREPLPRIFEVDGAGGLEQNIRENLVDSAPALLGIAYRDVNASVPDRYYWLFGIPHSKRSGPPNREVTAGAA